MREPTAGDRLQLIRPALEGLLTRDNAVLDEALPRVLAKAAEGGASVSEATRRARALAHHGGAERTILRPSLPTLLAGLEAVVLMWMGARHARANAPHLRRHRARFCEVKELICMGRWREILGKEREARELDDLSTSRADRSIEPIFIYPHASI